MQIETSAFCSQAIPTTENGSDHFGNQGRVSATSGAADGVLRSASANGADPVPAVPTRKPSVALFGDTGPGGEVLEEIYGESRLAELRRIADVYPEKITSKNIARLLPELRDVEAIVATWGMLRLSEEQLDYMPKLKVVFYAAGSVTYFARPLLQRGIMVVSGASANAVPVAEFTLGQILLANKGYFHNILQYRDRRGPVIEAFRGRGNYGATISILGAGQIGVRVIKLLADYRLNVIVFDPYLSAEEARRLRVEKVELAEAFERGDVVSNHLADLPATQGILHGKLFRSMPANATFINTGRGRTVNHDHLITVLQERPDLYALLDVTHPEPLPSNSPLWDLPNVTISGHIAGTIGAERGRIADLVMEEFHRWNQGEPLQYDVPLESLETRA